MKFFLVVLFFSLTVVVAANEQCFSSVLDEKAPLRNVAPAIAKLLPTGNFNYDKTMTGLKTILNLLPSSMEKCLANYQGQHLKEIVDFAMIRTKCMFALKKMDKPMDQLKQFMGRFPSGLDSSLVEFLTFLKGAEHESYESLCKPLTADLEPCLTNLLPVVFTSFQDNSNKCCDEMLTNAEKSLGSRLHDLVPEMLSLFLDSICSEKQMTSDMTQLCSYSIIQTFTTPNLMQFLGNIQTSFQIPNDQACGAFEGESFNLSTVGSKPYSFGTDATLGGCSQPLDQLASKIASFPVLQNSELLKPMFADQMCMDGNSAIPAVKKSFPPTIAVLVSGLIREKCLHVANGYSSSCQYSAPALVRSKGKEDSDDNQDSVVEDPGVVVADSLEDSDIKSGAATMSQHFTLSLLLFFILICKLNRN